MHWHIPFPSDPSQEIRLSAEQLRPVLEKLLVKKSVFQFDAATAVARMLEADLHGLSAYGCGRIGGILDALDVGDIDPRGRVLTVEDAPAFAVLDGSRAIGHVAATKGGEAAVSKARESGLGLAVIGNSQMLGAAAVFVRLIAEQGFLGMCVSSTGGATVAAPETRLGATGNTQFAYAVPLSEQPPLVVDTSCGTLAWEELDLLRRYGLPFPAGIAFDRDGSQATDFESAKVLRPAGEHLGFGLSLFGSLLAGPLAGGWMPIHKKRSPSAEDSQHVFLAIDISRFTRPEKFQKELTTALDEIRGLPPLNPAHPVRLPGDLQMECFRDRSEHGIPLHRTIVDDLLQRAARLKVAIPW